MNDKFIRVLSPVSLAVSFLIDIAVAVLTVSAFTDKNKTADFWHIAFYIIIVFAIIFAVSFTKEVFGYGVKFKDKSVEFVGADDENEIEYSSVLKVESYKDTKASFKKKLVERYSLIILTLDNGTQMTITLGYTTSKTLNKITDELKNRIK